MKFLNLILLLLLAVCGCSSQSTTTTIPDNHAKSVNDASQSDGNDLPNRISDSVSFVLEDAELRHAEYPDTFWIPPRKERDSIEIDQLVKLMFEITVDGETNTERMWVNVLRNRDGKYVGILDNDPFCTDQIKSGLEIRFSPKHIIEIYE